MRFTLPRIAFGQSFFLRHSKLAQATRRSGGGWERAGARVRGRVGVAYKRKYGKRRSAPPQQLPEIWGKLAGRG